MLNLEYKPALRMYVSAKPTPPVFALRAWVENPFKLFSHDPARLLCEIWNASPEAVIVRELDSVNFFTVTRAQIHAVHLASLATGEVIHYYGEPKPC